jgi:hypothetical protein
LEGRTHKVVFVWRWVWFGGRLLKRCNWYFSVIAALELNLLGGGVLGVNGGWLVGDGVVQM